MRPHRIIIEKNVACPMRDGTVLRADVYRPDDGEPHPVLLGRLPYDKNLLHLYGPILHPEFAVERGYIVVRQDVRGRYASDGEFYPVINEKRDGYDSVEWAARLPGSNGRVGMYGVSYMASTTWLAADAAPPSLRAIAPTQAPGDFFDDFWRGGAHTLGGFATWSLKSIAADTLRRRAVDGRQALEDYRRLLDDFDRFPQLITHLPPAETPMLRPDDPGFLAFWSDVVGHPFRGQFTEALSTPTLHAGVTVPAFVTAGWYDLFLRNDLLHYQAMRDRAGSEVARRHTKLLVGPWSHGAFRDVVGHRNLGARAAGQFVDDVHNFEDLGVRGDLSLLQLDWFDNWLRPESVATDDAPPVRIFVQGINRWRDEDDWPPIRARKQQWFLQGGMGLSRRSPPSIAPALDTYVYDPADPCPTLGGALLLHDNYPKGPLDQRPIQGRRDVLSYVSDPLNDDLEATGDLTFVLFAATNAADTDWIVKLCDVEQSGRAIVIADGIIRASYRISSESRQLLEPGKVERYEIDLWATSNVFRAGHRLGVIITSSDFPRYDRNPNTGELGVEATATKPALQEVHRSSALASHLLLPVV